MADPVTMSDVAMLSDQHSTIRRELAKEANTLDATVRDASYKALAAVDGVGDRLTSQLDKQFHRIEGRDYDSARDLADLRAQVTSVFAAVTAASDRAAKDSEIATLKNTLEVAKGQTAILEKIGNDGNETRRLINELKYGDLNRALIERNAELVDERHHSRYWRGGYDQAQFAAVSSQLQALQSQMQETRQGMVNFGTMAGVGQSSTSNNVR